MDNNIYEEETAPVTSFLFERLGIDPDDGSITFSWFVKSMTLLVAQQCAHMLSEDGLIDENESFKSVLSKIENVLIFEPDDLDEEYSRSEECMTFGLQDLLDFLLSTELPICNSRVKYYDAIVAKTQEFERNYHK